MTLCIKPAWGGALLDVGCYSVSVARWMMGAEPTQVQAQAIYHDTGVDVHFVGTLQFHSGGLATLEASFVSALQQTFSVVGTAGAIDLPHDAFIPWQHDAAYILRSRIRKPETELLFQELTSIS